MSGVCFYGPKLIYGNIKFRMTLKQMSAVCFYGRKLITVTFGSV